AIPYTELRGYHPRAGETIGFNLALDDADDRERVRQFLWRGRPDASRNRFSFGRAYLQSPTM
ncbi:hypothetical protein AMK68_02610, partial [candidate division KD3-62 bacterium DG_56]